MNTYGNTYWNQATDNREKSVITMREDAFLKMQESLEKSGLNYYAFAQNGALKMAVNDKDSELLKKVIGSPAADNLIVQKSAKSYIPPEKNIIGNAEYRFIPQKSYFKTDRDAALKMAEMLNHEGIRFSSRVQDDTATITVSAQNIERVREMYKEVAAMRSNISQEKIDREIIGNTSYKNITQKHFVFSNMSPEQYKQMQPYLDKEEVPYSGLITNGRVMFSVNDEDSVRFHHAFNTSINIVVIHENLHESGFTPKQTEKLDSLIHLAAECNLPYEVEHFFNPEYSEKQFDKLNPLVERYLKASETDRILDKDNVLSDILSVKSRFDTEIALNEVLQKNYSDEQKEAIIGAFQNGTPLHILGSFDNTYMPDEITDISEAARNHDAGEITELTNLHEERLLAQQEQIEKAQQLAEKLDVPFSEKFSEGADETFSPYDADGSMSMEDFRSVQDEFHKEQQAETEVQADFTNTYRELSRLQGDCDYFINHGCNPGGVKYLRNESAESHISRMRELFDRLPDSKKPEWLSAEDIDGYEKQMEDGAAKWQHIDECYDLLKDNVLSDERVLNAVKNSDRQAVLIEADSIILQKANEILLSNPAANADFFNDFSEKPMSRNHMDVIDEIYNALDEMRTQEKVMGSVVHNEERGLTAHIIGDFYEFRGEEAVKVAELLDLHVTKREGVDVTGFPKHALENYSEKLTELGYTLAISDAEKENIIEHDKTSSPMGQKSEESKEEQLSLFDSIPEQEEPPVLDDKAVTVEEMNNFGYSYEGMQPISTEKALELFDEDKASVYLLYDDGTEGMAENRDEIINHTGYLGVETEDWNKYLEHEEQISEEIPDKSEEKSFTITDETLGTGGAKAKFNANIAAIETLKTLESEKRSATDEEKQILSHYVGWGGLAQAFDSENTAWEKEFAQLKDTLTDKEYSAARASTLDAFYTSPTVISAIYEAVDKFGFEGGNVLEPAMGIGNFFGCMPTEMREESKLYGIELDSISGRIAQKLYPDADIAIHGFEKNVFQNECFDVAVGNVPFGELPFKDNKHGTNKLHDYFFAETLDKVKEGGIVAFVTSAGTLDKRDESTRELLSEKADFIGAIRLPGGKDGAFKDNAGTEVTSDIIFLQKNSDKDRERSDAWLHIGETADGLPINQYFADNPDMVLGTVIEGNKLYGSGTMVVADKGSDLKEKLHEAVSKLSATISAERPKEVYKAADGERVKPPEELRNFSFFEHKNEIYYKENDTSAKLRYNGDSKQFQRARAFINVRDITRELLTAQEQNKSDEVIKDLQGKLTTAYDSFYKKYGLLHSKTNKSCFRDDVSYPLVASLEKSFEKDLLKEKSDLFTKRTIKPAEAVTHVDTAIEALALSAAEKAKVDFDYMQDLTGMTKDELLADLRTEIFLVPFSAHEEYQTASEYLSGDIRKKLNAAQNAAETDNRFSINVEALKTAMPEPLKAADIDVRLGAAAWIDPKIYQQFMYETFGTPPGNRDKGGRSLLPWIKPIKIEYSEQTGIYHIQNKRADASVNATKNYGTRHMNAYEITEHLLNLKEPKVYKTVEVPDGFGETKEKRVVDPEATRLVQNKADKIRAAFKDWIFKDPERREQLVQTYNERFNSIRPREYDGTNLRFPMMNAEIELHDHQKNAIAHALFGGNTLFAHSVGAGKTFEMIATAMESKRLGLCTKSMFAVPNHLTEQIGDDFQKLYPSANILVATKKDFQKENRQQLFSKIATGNFDAVIIGHSQLGMIPMSRERQESLLQEQISDIIEGISELKHSEGSKFQVKAMERTRKSLEKQLEKLDKSHDDTITFEEMGIDKLFVDEAHEFKNLFTPTKLSNVSGISTSASQKALDLFQKCRYLDEKTGGRGVVFATGTPLSNSVTELHTMMRYLEYDFLKDKNLQHFDNWVTVFGEQKTDWELAPAGNKFKERTRIANYTGLPELMSMFKQIADVKTADMLKLDVPACELKVVNVEATDFQKTLVDELADRADAINSGNVDPSIDNMLRITSDGRKLGLDPRLIDPSFEDNPGTKLNQCVENVARIHADTADEKLTQIIFCDLGVPHKTSATVADGEEVSAAEANSLEEECDFCVYDDIRDKLIAKGIPKEEIVYIHDAKTEKQKSDLFDKVRKGDVRVLLGSTSKMGTGTNVQKKLIAVHDLDIPWRPSDLERAPVEAS